MNAVLEARPHPRAPIARTRSKELKVRLSLEIGQHEQVTVVHCKGRISYGDEAGELSQRVAALMASTRQLVLDLSGIEMMDSAGLGELVMVLMWAQACDCALKIAAPRKHVHELLELTNLALALEIYPTLDEAMMACRCPAA